MDFKTILSLYDRIPDELQTTFIVVILFLAYKGIIKLPFIPTITDRIKTYEKVWNIKTKETLFEQMNIVEVVHASIMFTLKKAYLNLNVTDKHAQHYELITQDAQKECKNIIRKWLKENHYTDRTEQEFDMYVSEKIDLLLEIVTYHFDLKYKDDFFEISRENLFNTNSAKVIPVARDKWRKMFYDCRDVSRKNEERIKTLEKECK